MNDLSSIIAPRRDIFSRLRENYSNVIVPYTRWIINSTAGKNHIDKYKLRNLEYHRWKMLRGMSTFFLPLLLGYGICQSASLAIKESGWCITGWLSVYQSRWDTYSSHRHPPDKCNYYLGFRAKIVYFFQTGGVFPNRKNGAKLNTFSRRHCFEYPMLRKVCVLIIYRQFPSLSAPLQVS